MRRGVGSWLGVVGGRGCLLGGLREKFEEQ